jgi:beta-N-acetylhexosaminidase
MTMENTLRNIGQLFMLGFPGQEPPAPFLDFIAEEQIGGIILFEENCPNYSKARENIYQLVQQIKTAPPLIAIDQEGGPVVRLRGAPAEFRGASEYARLDDVEHFREDYDRAVVLMTSMGINLNLAPVADLALNQNNKCMAGRCYGRTPQEAAKFIKASIAVAHSRTMLTCLKHFPGLGAAEVDPHAATATADYDRIVWEQRELPAFRSGVEAGADLVMTTHLLASELDDKMVTGSEKVVTELLRDTLEFDGPVITDDLTMKGADPLGDYGQRAVAAFMAGHDILMFCHDYPMAIEAYDYFVSAVRAGEIPVERVQEALERVAGIKLKLGRPVLR